MSRFGNVNLGGDDTMQRMIKAEQEKERLTWNAAIEAAAKELDSYNQMMASAYASDIRKLKK